jgi:hypothetical protein
MMVVIKVVVMVVVPATMRVHHDDGTTAEIAVMVMMMVVMVMVELRHLHVVFGRFRRRLLIQCLQHLRRIRDRLEQVGIGIGLHDIGRAGRRRSLSRAERADSGDRAQQSCDSLIHIRSPHVHCPEAERHGEGFVPSSACQTGRDDQPVNLFRKRSSSRSTASGCSCCTQWPAPSTSSHSVMLLQARVCIVSNAPGR